MMAWIMYGFTLLICIIIASIASIVTWLLSLLLVSPKQANKVFMQWWSAVEYIANDLKS